ncbi:hypothetical protein [Streptomyces sp. CNQ085]|uniref:hypothetical protein n=1 Tax=Streptomyces sp. CNQ085 TaxID=2886944 RepID=UPI001F505891|nr:hypothetical protein [Streptomyces sp. CNQ085]MCI0386057.1 hypothetical protein [Streptomyces sp. CNQ085]
MTGEAPAHAYVHNVTALLAARAPSLLRALRQGQAADYVLVEAPSPSATASGTAKATTPARPDGTA